MEPIPDFKKVKNFPGTLDNDFDIVLRKLEDLEKIPGPVFAAILLMLALPPTFGRWELTAGLWGFYMLDWILMKLLPRFQKSFGPAKPTVLILTLLRMLFAFFPFPVALIFQITGTLLVIYAFWIEPHRIHVTYQKLTSPKLRSGKPIRLLHLGDLHIERITKRERQLNHLIEELNPDIILFSGDVINLSYLEDPKAWKDAREILSGWRAPSGVFVVTGSPAVDLEELFPRLVEDMPFCWLKADEVEIEVNGQKITIMGISCSHKPFIDGPILDSLAERANGNFTVLVYHTPDLAPNAANSRIIDLQVSGHTHGGQLRLPGYGALFAASLYGKRFESGRKKIGNMTLYVTRGIGLEGKAAPRMRFLCPPEIILWEINGEVEASTHKL